MLFDNRAGNSIENLMIPLDKPLIIVMNFGGDFGIGYGFFRFVGTAGLQIRTRRRTVNFDLPFGATTDGANLLCNCRAVPLPRPTGT